VAAFIRKLPAPIESTTSGLLRHLRRQCVETGGVRFIAVTLNRQVFAFDMPKPAAFRQRWRANMGFCCFLYRRFGKARGKDGKPLRLGALLAVARETAARNAASATNSLRPSSSPRQLSRTA
jgi:hypothetical protein